MFKALAGLFKSSGRIHAAIPEINALEPEVKAFGGEQMLEESRRLQEGVERLTDRETQQAALDRFLPRAFALVREAARRTLGQRHFDVQLMGGIALHEGKIAEMRTGEGKTLAATAPVYLNALVGRGVHVVTVNEYLAKRDAVWMGQIYHALGMKVACLVHEGAFMYDPQYAGIPPAESRAAPDQPLREGGLLDKERDTTGSFRVQNEFLRPISRREAYAADITYGTNHEFGFDYLRDNLAYRKEDQTQVAGHSGLRGIHHYAIIDEVDSILIDEARTPLIISAPDTESSQLYKTFARVVARLEKEKDYLVDEKMRSVDITQEGIDKVEKALSVKNIYDPQNLRLVHYLQESLRAKELYLRDRDYVVKEGEIIIVDQFTGRLMPGRRYSGGLHQAIEAKDGVMVQQESRTFAQISIQNYFRLYAKLGGMTGTAQTSAEEFDKVYKLEVVTIPTNREMIRKDEPDLIYKTKAGKYTAIVNDIKERSTKGQPILIGTVSIEKNEELARELSHAGLKHEVLNAKNNEREGAIIAQAGRAGAITVATNMAGRGVDIILGGNPPDPEAARRVVEAGGLHVVGTERHEARRVDNQLRGRAGRQGDPGSSQFFLSLEDDLMRVFGGDRIKGLMTALKVPEDMPIQAGMINKAISQAQSKVEGMNFDARKHLLEYDDVLNKQRLAIYKKRQQLLESGELAFSPEKKPEEADMPADAGEEEKKQEVLRFSPQALHIALSALDMFWMSHLENMEALQESVRLRAYGQHDPLVEYRREGHLMFQQLLADFEQWVRENKERLLQSAAPIGGQVHRETQRVTKQAPALTLNVQPAGDASAGGVAKKKVGRNEPCPCGSGKKYKKCHGK